MCIIEGTAVSFESIYVQENYGANYFIESQNSKVL